MIREAHGPERTPQRAPRPPPLPARASTPALWARLEPYSAADRLFLVEEHEDFWDWALCELVTGKSLAAVAAAESLELAELALLIAELAPGEKHWRWRLEGWARHHLAIALRAGNEPRRAEEESIKARKLWQDGAPGDPGLLDEARMPVKAANKDSIEALRYE
jgi:hypothetical protein